MYAHKHQRYPFLRRAPISSAPHSCYSLRLMLASSSAHCDDLLSRLHFFLSLFFFCLFSFSTSHHPSWINATHAENEGGDEHRAFKTPQSDLKKSKTSFSSILHATSSSKNLFKKKGRDGQRPRVGRSPPPLIPLEMEHDLDLISQNTHLIHFWME